MLADTDAGSIITLAQSGARWGYALLVPNLVFIPFMFIAQELASRLGLGTGQGAGELVRRRWGRGPAIFLLLTLGVSCFGALVSEMSGLAGAGATYGIPVWVTMTVTVFGLTVMIATGSYRSVERIALFFGSFEIAFFVMAWNAQPGIAQIAGGASHMPAQDGGYLYLLAANLGTSVIPWALLYQQSASVDKRLGVGDIKGARIETLAGVVLCQLVTSAFLIAAGATLGHGGANGPLETVEQIGTAFTSTLGPTVGKVIFIFGLTGGALVGTIVVCLTLAWTFGEVLDVHHSLARRPRQGSWFYGVLGLMIVASGVLVASGVNLIDLTIVAGVINAALLPIVLSFLYWLGRAELPEALRLRGAYAVLVAAAFLLLGGVAVFSGLVGALT
ncbi:MAG TPA: divalent metal cation transporter [Stellaceae bacterium]|nr:divalent metal cation transporter [Stellaceae bacterium]